MSRYLLKFGKKGNLKYISHLDLLRLFQRGFKRAHIKLKYSQGFNPHAKIGFALPLSLGFESEGEYMEFETDETYDTEDIKARLKSCMPKGLKVYECGMLTETSKTAVAAALEYASYIVIFRGDEQKADIIDSRIKSFMDQKEIISVKFSKKKKKEIESDIRPHIKSVNSIKGKEGLTLSLMLKTGSMGNLNAETLCEELCRFCGIEYERSEWSFTRTEMYFSAKKNLKPLTEFKG